MGNSPTLQADSESVAEPRIQGQGGCCPVLVRGFSVLHMLFHKIIIEIGLEGQTEQWARNAMQSQYR